LTKLRSSWPRRGPDFLITGEYWYSGLTGEGLWGEIGQTKATVSDCSCPTRSSIVDQLMVDADYVVGLGAARAALHAAILHRC
jgi:hypothetical protein